MSMQGNGDNCLRHTAILKDSTETAARALTIVRDGTTVLVPAQRADDNTEIAIRY